MQVGVFELRPVAVLADVREAAGGSRKPFRRNWGNQRACGPPENSWVFSTFRASLAEDAGVLPAAGCRVWRCLAAALSTPEREAGSVAMAVVTLVPRHM